MKYVIEFEEVVRYQVEVEGSLQDVSTRWHNIDVHAQFDANADCAAVLERQLISVTDAEQQLVPLDPVWAGTAPLRHVVTSFGPQELGTADPERVRERLHLYGQCYIDRDQRIDPARLQQLGAAMVTYATTVPDVHSATFTVEERPEHGMDDARYVLELTMKVASDADLVEFHMHTKWAGLLEDRETYAITFIATAN